MGKHQFGAHFLKGGLLACLLLMESNAASPPPLPLFQATATGLIGYWNLDELTGPTANDSSASNIDGTWVGTPTVMTQAAQLPPPFGGIANAACLDFSGTGQAVNLGVDRALLNNATATTVSCWIFPDATVLGTGVCIAVGPPPGTSGTSRVSLELTATGQIQGLARGADTDGARTRQSPAGTVVTGVWAHIAMTVDYPTAAIRIYKNGAEITTGVVDNGVAIATATSATNAKNAAFACNDDATGAFHDGRMDDVRVYNRVLTSAEMRALCAPAPPTGLNATGVTGGNNLTWTSGQPGTVTYAVYAGPSAAALTLLQAGVTGTTFSHMGASTTAPTFYAVRTEGLIESVNSNVDSDTAIVPPPRTTKVGGEHNECGCGTTGPIGPAALGALALALLLLIAYLPLRS